MANRSLKKVKKNERLRQQRKHIKTISNRTQKISQHVSSEISDTVETAESTPLSGLSHTSNTGQIQDTGYSMDIGYIQKSNSDVELDVPQLTVGGIREESCGRSFVALSNVEMTLVSSEEHSEGKLQDKYINSEDFELTNELNIYAKNSDEEELPELTIETVIESDDFQPITGRRLIDINYFLAELQSKARHNGLFDCKTEHFRLVGEKRLGLISKFKFECSMCHKFVVIKSEDSNDENSVNANIAATSGIIASGIGYSQFQEVFSALDLPVFSTKSYSKFQNQVYEKWEEVAIESMEAAAMREKEAAISEGRVKNGVPFIDVFVDGCWSARSYGTNFKALSGAAAIIGKKYGEVLYIGVKNKYCLICARAEKREIIPKDHNCFKNYSGASSAMESDIIVEGFQSSLSMYGLIYSRLIADGDSSTYSKILNANPYKSHQVTVEKIECRNHILRNFCKKLRNLNKETKYALACRKTLTNSKIMIMRKSIVKSIEYHNKVEDKPKSTSISLLHNDINNSLNHAYGDHRFCKDYNCSMKQNEKNEMATIQSSTFLFRLNAITATVASKSRSLIENVDTNTVERFNSVVAKFVGGKRINFSQKRGYQSRCSAAVVSFNKGSTISSVQKAFTGVSPKGKLKEMEQRRSLKRKLNKEHPIKKIRKFQDKTNIQHNYGPTSSAPDMSLEQIEKSKLHFIDNLATLVEDRELIERSTVLQRDSSEWIELRKKIITASNFGPICKKRPSTDSSSLVKNILYQKNLSNITAVAHGIEKEKQALQQMQEQESVIIEPCGLFIDKEYPFIGASPDGTVGKDAIVEIKCPLTAYKNGLDNAVKNNKIQILNYDKKTDNYNIKKTSNWYYQVQGQLRVTGRRYCLFGIWSGETKPVHVLKIMQDRKFWEEKMKSQLVSFYINSLLPEIVDPRKIRGMAIRKIKENKENN